MATDTEVLVELQRVTAGELALDEFEDWFVTATWESDSPLVRTVTGFLAESSGNDGDAVVLAAFQQLVHRPTVTVPLTFSWSSNAADTTVVPVVMSAGAQGAVVIMNAENWPSVTRETEFRVPA